METVLDAGPPPAISTSKEKAGLAPAFCFAYEDLPADLMKGSYNPWKYMPEKTMEDDSRILLTMMMSECCRAFEQLPILKNADILRNILYSGVWTAYERVRKTREKPRKPL